jgi:hypothetical protein
MVNVELVYIPVGHDAIHLHITVSAGATVADVLHQSGLYASHPETKDMSVGIFAKIVILDTVVKQDDRVEIYRPLMIDPKEKRRQRAKQK